MTRPLICPVCGGRGTPPAARCTSCGAPFDLDTSGAVGAERIRRKKAVALMMLGAGMVWWLLEILDGPTLEGVLIPAAISFVGFAELTYLAITERKLKDRHERELASANARMRGAPAEEAPQAEGAPRAGRPPEDAAPGEAPDEGDAPGEPC